MKKTLALLLALVSIFGMATTAFAADEMPEENQTIVRELTDEDIKLDVQGEIIGTLDTSLHGESADEIEDEINNVTGSSSAPVIHVDIEWEELKFVYDFGTVAEYDWDIDELEYKPVLSYVNEKGPDWVDNSKDITFINRSNRVVYAGVSFKPNTETTMYKDVTVDFDRSEVVLESAVGGTLDTQVIQMTVDGAPVKPASADNIPALGCISLYVSGESRLPAEDAD